MASLFRPLFLGIKVQVYPAPQSLRYILAYCCKSILIGGCRRVIVSELYPLFLHPVGLRRGRLDSRLFPLVLPQLALQQLVPLHHGVQRPRPGVGQHSFALAQYGLHLARADLNTQQLASNAERGGEADLQDPRGHLLIALTRHAGDHPAGHVLFVPGHILSHSVQQGQESTAKSLMVDCLFPPRKFKRVLFGRVRLKIVGAYQTNLCSYQIEHSLFSLVVHMVEVGMLVPHMAVQIELLELSEPTEAEQAKDLLAEVVAEVAVTPHLLEGAAILDARCWRWIFQLIYFIFI